MFLSFNVFIIQCFHHSMFLSFNVFIIQCFYHSMFLFNVFIIQCFYHSMFLSFNVCIIQCFYHSMFLSFNVFIIQCFINLLFIAHQGVQHRKLLTLNPYSYITKDHLSQSLQKIRKSRIYNFVKYHRVLDSNSTSAPLSIYINTFI